MKFQFETSKSSNNYGGVRKYHNRRVKEKLESILDIKIKKYQSLIINSNELNNIEQNNKTIEKYINKFLNMKNPSRELIVNLFDRIDIYEDKTINIKVTFANS